MMSGVRVILAVFFAGCLSIAALAQAPVVDDSENYALLEGQQADLDRPVSRQPFDVAENDSDEVALAREEPAFAQDSASSPSVDPQASNQGFSEVNKNDGASLLAKIQGLQQEVRELRGQLEVQSHDLKQLQEQQLSFYKDLDARLRNVPAKSEVSQTIPAPDLSIGEKTAKSSAVSPSISSVPVMVTVPQPASKSKANTIATQKSSSAISTKLAPVSFSSRANPADEQIRYLAAYELVKNKRYEEASTAMQNFIVRYPQSGYTANAQYWLGEIYLTKREYLKAIKHFEVVVEQFPSSNKSAPSLLKIGYALAYSGKAEEAKQRLQEVIKNYPDTSSARLATVKLVSLGV